MFNEFYYFLYYYFSEYIKIIMLSTILCKQFIQIKLLLLLIYILQKIKVQSLFLLFPILFKSIKEMCFSLSFSIFNYLFMLCTLGYVAFEIQLLFTSADCNWAV